MGRGKRNRPLADRDWPRRVPLPEPQPAPQLAIRDRQALQELVGAYVNGYTSEQISETAPLFERALGLPIVCVWDYVDWSTGGSSEIFLVCEGRHYAMPQALAASLYEGAPLDEEALERELETLTLGEHSDSFALVDVDAHNLALEDRS
jgi:hypothetical protein